MTDVIHTDAFRVMQAARTHVRSRTRAPKYIEHSDHFCMLFLGKPWGVEPDYYKAVGTDAQIIDFYYECLLSDGEAAAPILKQFTRQLQEMVEPSRAAAALPELQNRLKAASCVLADVACGILAAITILGRAALLRRTSAAVADRWLMLWQSRVWQQNRQQEIHCGLCLLTRLPAEARARVIAALEIPEEALLPKSRTFADGIREYLSAFSDTGASAVALIGGIPFADKLSDDILTQLIEFLETTPEYIEVINQLLRLAPDVKFDDEEPVSLGSAALAAARGTYIMNIDVRQVAKAEIEEKLQEEWVVCSREYRQRMDSVLVGVRPRDALYRALADVADAAFFIAQAVTSAPHKAQ